MEIIKVLQQHTPICDDVIKHTIMPYFFKYEREGPKFIHNKKLVKLKKRVIEDISRCHMIINMINEKVPSIGKTPSGQMGYKMNNSPKSFLIKCRNLYLLTQDDMPDDPEEYHEEIYLKIISRIKPFVKHAKSTDERLFPPSTI